MKLTQRSATTLAATFVMAAALFTVSALAERPADADQQDAKEKNEKKTSRLSVDVVEAKKGQPESKLSDSERALLGTWERSSFLNQKVLFTAERSYQYDYSVPGQKQQSGEWKIENGTELVYLARKADDSVEETMRSRIMAVNERELKLQTISPAGQDKVYTFTRVEEADKTPAKPDAKPIPLGKKSTLQLHTRSRESGASHGQTLKALNSTVNWEPDKTALIVVDMWDDHWCEGAAKRVTEMAGPMDQFIAEARRRGVFIVHCPSTCVDFYKDTEARRRAIEAPYSKTTIELATTERWGTAWCWPDKSREPELPIDDSDMGCDCETQCKIEPPWKRQIATIEIDDSADAITDNGQELYNLFSQRCIENVMICGVHLNMCVLGRPFGIRQLTKLGKNVVLVRDLTDTMYNHRMRPFTDHFSGTDLVIEHVEKFWCPSIESTDLVDGKPFRFVQHRKETAAQR